MNWLTNFIRPKIRSIVGVKDVPDNLWQKCPSCEGMLFHRDLTQSMNVCTHCGYHMKLGVKERLAMLFDEGKYTRIELPNVPQDPLKFRDKKKYSDRLRDAQTKTGEKDAIIVALGAMGGLPVVIAAFNFDFMGGSMGASVGEGLVRAAETAVAKNAALIAIPASGGARMQEGMVSLVQLPRSVIAVRMVKDEGLPYIVLLTDPTTGGVSASFAMLGDIHIAEPGCMIGFAGKRVIEETIREQLPKGFQTAEYLRDHGMVDLVVPRTELQCVITRILGLLMNRKVTSPKDKSGKPDKSNGKDTTGDRHLFVGKTTFAPHATINALPDILQMLEREGRLPDSCVACIGGGSNAIGLFYPFVDDPSVRLIGVEAGGLGVNSGKHAASLTGGRPGVLHGNRTYLLQNDDGQIEEAHSISAGLDYPGIGPEHSWLHDTGRAEYVSVTDDEALSAFQKMAKLEGIIPALEPAHAFAHVMKIAPTLPKDHIMVMNLCGRGDKDVPTVAELISL